MKHLFHGVVLALAVTAVLLLNGCESYPSFSEIPPMQTYPDNKTHWNTDAVCLVGQDDDARWEYNLPGDSPQGIQWVHRHTAGTVQRLLRLKLEDLGYQVQDFTERYPTRQKRLGVNKVVICQGFSVNKTVFKEGTCYDMKLVARVVDTDTGHDQFEVFEVHGRSFIPHGETATYADIFKDCIDNIANVPDLRMSLELKAVVATYRIYLD